MEVEVLLADGHLGGRNFRDVQQCVEDGQQRKCRGVKHGDGGACTGA